MPNRTAEEFEAQARELLDPNGYGLWEIGRCSLCGSPTGYVFRLGQVGFDGGCDCAMGPIQPATWQDVAAHYNIQTNAEVLAQYDAFWGFAPVEDAA